MLIRTIGCASWLILFLVIPGWAGTLSLDGDWLFYPVSDEVRAASETRMVERFTSPQLPPVKWKKIKVPGYWDQTPGNWPWIEPTIPGGPDPDHNGEAWYRLNFRIPPETYPSQSAVGENQDLLGILRFEGVAAQASVWLNGTFIGKRTLGAYKPFEISFAASILHSATNVLVVRVFDKTLFFQNEAVPATLSSLPSEIRKSQIPLGYDPEAGGIYRSVSLRLVPTQRFEDISLTPSLQAVAINMIVSREAVRSSTLELSIDEKATGTRIYGPRYQPLQYDFPNIPGLTISITNLASAQPWTPESPILYRLTARLLGPHGELDAREIVFGFRTFTISGNKFLLNGKPYFLFGAGSPPHYENPSEEVARTHLKALKDAGIRMVRFSDEPPAEFWLRLCDEIGLLAWIEGPLSVETSLYDLRLANLVKQASEEMIAVANQLQNHPSAVIWTVGSGNQAAAGLIPELASDTEKNLIMLASVLSRYLPSSSRIVLPDGNNHGTLVTPVEDWYSDLGWYQGRVGDWLPFLKSVSGIRPDLPGGGPPWVSSQLLTGYSSSGQGQIIPTPQEEAAARMRIGTPVEEEAALLEYQAQRTKTMIEEARALRDPTHNRIAGVFPFNAANWFYNPLTPAACAHKPIIDAISKAYAPIALTMNSSHRHYYSGEIMDASFSIANDDIRNETITTCLLSCEIVKQGGQEPVSAQREISQVGYYSSRPYGLAIKVPETETLESAIVKVRITSGGRDLASNESLIRIGNPDYCHLAPTDQKEGVAVYDPLGTLIRYAESRKVTLVPFTEIQHLRELSGLIIGADGFDQYLHRAFPSIRDWISAGGRMLVLSQKKHESRWRFSGPYPGNRRTQIPIGWGTGIDFVNVRLPDHPIFFGVNKSDLQNWGRDGVVARYVYAGEEGVSTDEELRIRTLVDVVPSSAQVEWNDIVYEVSLGEGKILFSQLELLEKVAQDPIAALILKNAIRWVGSNHKPVLAKITPLGIPFRAPLEGNKIKESNAREGGVGLNDGIRAIPLPNATFEIKSLSDQAGTTFKGVQPTSSLGEVYYDLDDGFWFDQPGSVEIQVQVFCEKPSIVRLDYDSADNLLGSASTTKRTSPRSLLEVGVWKILVFSVPDARFANRQYEKCDFRLVREKGEVVFGPMVIRRTK